jgi:predicted transcriptional regulator YdeE
MQYETITLDLFYLMGIAVRTTNEGGQSQRDIGLLWQRFYKDNILAQIPNKKSDAVYCVYTDYEQDANGFYTTILGCAVSTLQTSPGSLIGITIPKAMYRVYTSVGKLPDSVLATWMHIWTSTINRAFAADFDLYGAGAQDSHAVEVKTYLSVR